MKHCSVDSSNSTYQLGEFSALQNIVMSMYSRLNSSRPKGSQGYYCKWKCNLIKLYHIDAGVSTDLVDKILNTSYLDNELGHFRAVREILQTTAPWASSWVGEAGGAYNSGHHLVTDAFVFSFWLVHLHFLRGSDRSFCTWKTGEILFSSSLDSSTGIQHWSLFCESCLTSIFLSDSWTAFVKMVCIIWGFEVHFP